MEKFKKFSLTVLRNPIFWVVVAILLLVFGIEYLERFTEVNVQNQYQIF